MLVVLLVVGPISISVDVVQPISIRLIPINRQLKSLFERYQAFPAEFILYLFAIQSVAAVVPWTVLHESQPSIRFANYSDHPSRHGDIFLHVRAADVIDLSDTAAFKYRQNSPAIVLNVNPITLLPSIPVNRKWLSAQCVRN